MSGIVTLSSSQSQEDRVIAQEPIDLAHLGRATFGDRSLQREVLALFEAQSLHLLTQIATPEVDAPSRAALAHKLKGSALGIGAWYVAEAAEAVETVLGASAEAPHLEVAALVAAVEEAQTFIRNRMDDALPSD